jgi:hypothetical protein
VWARNGVATTECPRSYITAESIGFVEEHAVWRAARSDLRTWNARSGEAILALEQEMERERIAHESGVDRRASRGAEGF